MVITERIARYLVGKRVMLKTPIQTYEGTILEADHGAVCIEPENKSQVREYVIGADQIFLIAVKR